MSTPTGDLAAAAEHARTIPLEDIDVAQPALFQTDTMWPYLERLRRDAPIHYSKTGLFGPYWSVVRFRDIQQVEADPQTFSSDAKYGGMTLKDQREGFRLPMFIAMDPPEHGVKRAVVSPVASPSHVAEMEGNVRKWAAEILDGLPRDQTFDWVDRVAIELTAQFLVSLFGIPQEDRRKLIHWSDVATAIPESGRISEADREATLLECLAYFRNLWAERASAPPQPDLISMMAHADATRSMSPMEYLANVMLLLVGGNDTTRNAITGGLLALSQNPGEHQKLRDNHGLIPNMVQEMIRWQSPIAHQRRTATRDTELGGQTIHAGDKVALWYVSANRDEAVIEDANRFIIDRAQPKRHLAFGFGIHRCMGERLAEMQLRILWEEIVKRFPVIEVVGEPTRVASVFIRGYESLPVRIPA